MEFIISQLCGIAVSVAAILSMQLKNIKHILICQLLCNFLGAISYIMLGGFSGCGIYIAACVQTVLYYVFNLKNIKPHALFTVFFMAVFLMCSIATYQGFEDVISAVAALTCAMALSRTKPSGYRFFMLLNGLLWLIYDLCMGAYGMMFSHIVTMCSAAVGIIRLDLKLNKAI